MDVLVCDTSLCGSKLLARDTVAATRAHARAKGWHIWTGTTFGGEEVTVVLCERCVQSRRRDLPPAPGPLEGQLSLFEDPPPGEVQ